MTKPSKSPYYVEPQFAVGDAVTKRGIRYTVAEIRRLNSGNRPMYRLEELQGVYPEGCLAKVRKTKKGKK